MNKKNSAKSSGLGLGFALLMGLFAAIGALMGFEIRSPMALIAIPAAVTAITLLITAPTRKRA